MLELRIYNFFTLRNLMTSLGIDSCGILLQAKGYLTFKGIKHWMFPQYQQKSNAWKFYGKQYGTSLKLFLEFPCLSS